VAIVLPKLSRRRPSSRLAAEAQPAVRLSLCNDEATYRAGSSLTATWRISRVPLHEIQSLEVSVLWHTEGKGDEDFHVHHFHRLSEAQVRRGGLAEEESIQCVLPPSPLSYHGQLISIRWCVRLRLYLANGREIVAEQPFYLVSPQMLGPCTPVPPSASVLCEADATVKAGESLGSPSRLVAPAVRL
jgi:hypothetical protein